MNLVNFILVLRFLLQTPYLSVKIWYPRACTQRVRPMPWSELHKENVLGFFCLLLLEAY